MMAWPNSSPGITIHPAPGHSAGLQFVRVHTKRGWVVLASDVTHFYENMDAYKPYVTAFHIGNMLEGFDKLRAAAPSPQHIIPGHDPLVMKRYKAPRPDWTALWCALMIRQANDRLGSI